MIIDIMIVRSHHKTTSTTKIKGENVSRPHVRSLYKHLSYKIGHFIDQMSQKCVIAIRPPEEILPSIEDFFFFFFFFFFLTGPMLGNLYRNKSLQTNN